MLAPASNEATYEQLLFALSQYRRAYSMGIRYDDEAAAPAIEEQAQEKADHDQQ